MEGKDFGVFSLEEDEFNDLFITQNSGGMKYSEEYNESDENEGLFSDVNMEVEAQGLKFSQENANDKCMYSDISDPEDDFIDPIYGRTKKKVHTYSVRNRYVNYLLRKMCLEFVIE